MRSIPLAGLLAGMACCAQASPATNTDEQALHLEQISVTATREAQKTSEIPASISQVDALDI